jgi:PBP1b-binding outer membrane lipoprotein LpoB
MRTITGAVVAIATLLTAACSAAQANRSAVAPADAHRLPVSHVAIRDLPQLPAHGPDSPSSPSTADAKSSDPRAFVEQVIADGLRSEGLELLDVGVVTITADGERATVRVAATHQTVGSDRPHTSVYDLDLVKSARGGWNLAAWHDVR